MGKKLKKEIEKAAPKAAAKPATIKPAARPVVELPPTPAAAKPVKTSVGAPAPTVAKAGKPATAAPAPVAAKSAKPAALAPAPAAAKPTAKAPARKAATTAILPADIALRAYFIAERRRNAGLSGDESHDWIQAETELRAEAAAKKSPARKTSKA